MNKKTIILTALLALVTMMGLAQTKTATVIGYSPALKDGTLVFAGTGSTVLVVDTVQAGRFAYTLPVEEFTESSLSFHARRRATLQFSCTYRLPSLVYRNLPSYSRYSPRSADDYR